MLQEGEGGGGVVALSSTLRLDVYPHLDGVNNTLINEGVVKFGTRTE